MNEPQKPNISTEIKTRIFSEVVEMLKWFASQQIRNVASISGNIITASPISDLNPLLVAAGATVQAMSKDRGCRTLTMDKDFFCGYRQTALAPDEILVSVDIPFSKSNEYFSGFKQCNRKEDDISMVNAGMLVRLSEDWEVNKLVLAYGGMGPALVLARSTMETAVGQKWDDNLFTKLCDSLASDLVLAPGSPGGAVEYRRALALSFLFKFFLQVKQRINPAMPSSDLSALQPMESSDPKTMQVVGAQDSRSKVTDCVGQIIPHKAALQQSTGQAIYVDDMVPTQDEVHMALVTSTKAFAKILTIDYAAALAVPGVVDYISAKDVPGQNSLQSQLDSVFSEDEVTCQGYIIGAVVADSADVARRAAKMIKIEYEDKSPIVITIEDAIKHSSFYPGERRISTGNLEAGFAASTFTLTGEIRMNGQNHFYLETMSTRALPGEAGEMEVFCSTQHPKCVQEKIAIVLGLPSNKIVVRTKRMGGGFGGKETQSALSAVPCAVAAHKLQRPVRCVLDRDEDMVTTGNRHPFLAKYKVGFSPDGKLHALDLELYSNAGNSLDRSFAVIERGILQVDSCYKVENLRIVAKCCKTNIMSNTAFRGFGGLQGTFIAEAIQEDVAEYLGIEPLKGFMVFAIFKMDVIPELSASHMEDDKKRGKNYTAYEKGLLLEILKRYPIIEDKGNDNNINNKKQEAWDRVTTEYNSHENVAKREKANLEEFKN
ncbi:xanthine dehydrogenase/oxidase-like [Plakobranchus ocellatus]|uniref:Xanthine dehydrogenase/oxidase-like n=1 Tax=Plakobranchus ocellatus TaxID=259542 RepID=A0AAV4CRQ9_9GAST|nr:xanthine dehydrogenase/oxidase-like [Plakobranchus ocellatus]